MKQLVDDGDNFSEKLRTHVMSSNRTVRDIFNSFELHLEVDQIEKANLLYRAREQFS